MIRGIHHVALHVGDLDRAVAFYVDALGFAPVADMFAWRDDVGIDRAIGVAGSAARTRMLRLGSTHVEIFEYAAPPPTHTMPLLPNDRGYTHLALDVTDIEGEMARLSALGMRFAADRPVGGPDLRSIYGHDPDGNLIELQELADDHPFAVRPAPAG